MSNCKELFPESGGPKAPTCPLHLTAYNEATDALCLTCTCIDQQVCTGYVSGVPEFWFICFSASFAFLKELAGS